MVNPFPPKLKKYILQTFKEKMYRLGSKIW